MYVRQRTGTPMAAGDFKWRSGLLVAGDQWYRNKNLIVRAGKIKFIDIKNSFRIIYGGSGLSLKSEILSGRMCRLLAGNAKIRNAYWTNVPAVGGQHKISHKRELVMLRYYNSLFSFSRDETYKGKERGFADYYCICKRIRWIVGRAEWFIREAYWKIKNQELARVWKFLKDCQYAENQQKQYRNWLGADSKQGCLSDSRQALRFAIA